MPSVFQQRAEQAQQAHAKAAVAMHMLAAKRAALQRQKQIALRKQKPTPQAQQEKTLHQAAHQENLLEANMHERGPYGWLGSFWSDLAQKAEQTVGKVGSALTTAGKDVLKVVAPSYAADLGGFHNYFVTPAGAWQVGQNPTAAEKADWSSGEYTEERLLPSQVGGQVLELQSEYGHNSAEQFLLGMANSQGNIVANPVSSAQQYGIGSSQFDRSLGISVGTVLLEAAPIPGGQAAADIATTAGKAGLSVLGQKGVRAGIGAGVGAASGLGLGLLNGASGTQLLEDVGIGAAAGATIALTAKPSGSLIRSITSSIEKENPATITSDTAGHFTSDNSVEEVTQSTIKQTVPKFSRFGYYKGTEDVIGKYTVGSHITPISSAEENGFRMEQSDISSSITKSIKAGENPPETTSDVLRGTATRISKPDITVEDNGLTTESGKEVSIINGKSEITGNEFKFAEGSRYFSKTGTDNLFQSEQEVSTGQTENGMRFGSQSTSGLAKQWLNPVDLKFTSPEEVGQIYEDLRSPAPSDLGNEENLPSDLKNWLNNEGLNNELRNDETYNEFKDRFQNTPGEKSTQIVEKTGNSGKESNLQVSRPSTSSSSSSSPETESSIISTRLPVGETIGKSDFLNNLWSMSFSSGNNFLSGIGGIGLGIGMGSIISGTSISLSPTKINSNTNKLKNPTTRLPTITPSPPITQNPTKTISKTKTQTKTQTTTTTQTPTQLSTQTGLQPLRVNPLTGTGGVLFPVRHHEEPAQQLFPIRPRLAKRNAIKGRKSYFAFPDLLNENEYQFATGKRAHALKITPQNAKVYNRMFSQSLGLNVLTQEQLQRKARNRKSRHRNRLF